MLVTRINNRIRTTWTRVRPVRLTKVVGIGLPKTGTTSLGYCLRRFGYKHHTYDIDLALKVKRDRIDEVLAEAEKFESFEDWPWFSIYRELDKRFPGSKFILTLRKDTATYVRSLQGHHEREGIRNKDFVKPHWWDEVHGMNRLNGITSTQHGAMKSTIATCSNISTAGSARICWWCVGKTAMGGAR